MAWRKIIGANASLPLALLAAVVIGFLLFGMTALVDEFDRSAQLREEQIVEHGITARVHEIATTVVPQVMWDDAVKHLDNQFDQRWANDNLGAYLYKTGGFNEIFVVDRSDRPVFASTAGAPVPLSNYSGFAARVHSLIGRVRRREAERGPLPLAPLPNGVLSPAIQATDIIADDDEIYVVVATLVGPDFGRFRPRFTRAPIVVTAMLIDQNLLDGIASRFLLDTVHLRPGNSQIESDEAHAALYDAQGHHIATMDWLPQRPGHTLLGRIGPSMSVIGIAVLFAIAFFHRRNRLMARGLIASEARATHLAFHDTLTGLPNRRLFLDRLAHALVALCRSPGTVIVHCIDLDRFKEINDTLGHLVGDELIRAAARRMASQCRSSETFSRMSGDEFAILQTNATAADAAVLAARLCAVMQEPFELGSSRVFVACSIGIATTTECGIDPNELFRRADLALYRAKADARGHFCIFEQDMDAAIKSRRSLESDLRDAIEEGALQLHYQPQVDCDARMTGVEALVRWRHPARGDISPALFIPIAEQSGLIAALGMFTLRRAFEDSRRWKNLRVGINISANQIRMREFVPALSQLIAETGVNPSNFELELNEGVLLRDDPETHATLRSLRSLGFPLVLDDFGTGYSSLSYLRRYPINKIKIDRSFVSNLGVESDSEEVVAAIVRLARALRMAVIAEGVETADQWNWVNALGCTDAQGYLFGKAVPADDIDELWRSPAMSLPRPSPRTI